MRSIGCGSPFVLPHAGTGSGRPPRLISDTVPRRDGPARVIAHDGDITHLPFGSCAMGQIALL